MTKRWLAGAALATVVMGVAGCGDDDGDVASTVATAAAPAGLTSADHGDSGGTIPATLVGTYAMTLPESALPADPPPELVDGPPRWKLVIASSGGVDDAPALTIANAELGTLESSGLKVTGDRILLHGQECAAAGSLVGSEYRWQRTGESLRLTVVKNGCPDQIALTLLTAQTWKRTGG